MKLLPYITAPFKITDLSTEHADVICRCQWSTDKKSLRLTPVLPEGQEKTYPCIAYWDVSAKGGRFTAFKCEWNSAEYESLKIIGMSIGGAGSMVQLPNLPKDCRLIQLTPTGKFKTAGLPDHDVTQPQPRLLAMSMPSGGPLFR